MGDVLVDVARGVLSMIVIEDISFFMVRTRRQSVITTFNRCHIVKHIRYLVLYIVIRFLELSECEASVIVWRFVLAEFPSV